MRESEAIQRATMRPYTVRGKTYRPHPVKVGDTFDGIASWYGPDFHAKATSNGETYNMHAHTAAHKTFPMNTIVKVYNKDNGKSTVVRINDRGPFVEGRIIDLSNVAAHDIAMVSKGIANVRIEVVGFGGDLVNNTPPKDSTSQTISQQVTQKQTKSTVANPHTQKEEQTTQQPQNTILKPKKETQVTRTEDTLGKDSASINQSNNIQTKQTHNNTNIASIQDSKTQDKISHNTLTNNPNSKSKAVDSTPLVISEEELPDFDEETKDETKEIQTKTQPEKPTTPEPATSNITPKYIDNTESIKDIDDAMQRLKDSTENLARNARNELKDQVKEDALNKQQETTMTTKIENVDSQNHNDKDSKMTDSNHAKKGNFMISLNVFSDENRAKSFKNDNLNIIKDTNYSIDIVLTDKGYRVALRGFETYDEAKSFIARHDIKGYVTQEIK
ncbi:septal ring lytic transglycosylase RlpA family protein [Helicobacter trogontum]|uniref:Probable endolytic peptidoglycan transglycosylase RlpA n=2 Tax=Helicobacter trogontum TaxID=50960 RepID=A0A4V6YRY7_9HELI|nr:septal ring lytic transglycosylase RlpA family protein [Helicobacter trogontum]